MRPNGELFPFTNPAIGRANRIASPAWRAIDTNPWMLAGAVWAHVVLAAGVEWLDALAHGVRQGSAALARRAARPRPRRVSARTTTRRSSATWSRLAPLVRDLPTDSGGLRWRPFDGSILVEFAQRGLGAVRRVRRPGRHQPIDPASRRLHRWPVRAGRARCVRPGDTSGGTQHLSRAAELSRVVRRPFDRRRQARMCAVSLEVAQDLSGVRSRARTARRRTTTARWSSRPPDRDARGSPSSPASSSRCRPRSKRCISS